ncbi:MAG: hypothetical protein U1E15_11180 [Hyphomicrobiales bacterium]
MALPAAAFDEMDLGRVDTAVKASRAQLDSVMAGVDAGNLTEAVLSEQRSAIDKIKSDVLAEGKLLDQPQADVAAQLASFRPGSPRATPPKRRKLPTSASC